MPEQDIEKLIRETEEFALSDSIESEERRTIAVPAQSRVRIQGRDIRNLISNVTLTQPIDNHHILRVTIRHVAEAETASRTMDPSEFSTYLGKTITLNLPTTTEGSPGDDAIEFTGIIIGVNFDHQIATVNQVHLTAASPTITLDKARKRRFFMNQSPSDIVSAVLGDHSITVGSTESAGRTEEFTVQFDETDYEFIKRLASSYGLFSFYDGTEFKVVAANASDRLDLSWPENLGAFSVNLGTGQMNFESYFYSYLDKRTLSNDTTSASPGASLSGPLAKSPTASRDIFTNVSFQSVGKARDNRSLDGALQTEMKSSVGKMISCHGKSSLASLTVGKCTQINGLGDLDGLYYVTRVVHHFGESGTYYNEFWCTPVEVAFPQRYYGRPRISQLQPAVVTDNNDPDKLGRVKVKFPWNPSGETPWIRVATQHAGKDRGFYMIPEIEDEVLVGYEFGNPDLPIVLASLYNGTDTPLSKAVTESNDVKAITTRSGNEIFINDESGRETIEITNKDGKNQIVLTLDGPSITIKSDGDITLDGKNITIKASQALSLESGTDTKIKAGANLNAEASASGKLKASATLDVEGAMLNAKGNPINLN